jgi:hypothetical protein
VLDERDPGPGAGATGDGGVGRAAAPDTRAEFGGVAGAARGAASRARAAARQPVPAGWKASTGQLPLEPVQVSAASHTAVAARHDVPATSNWQLAVQQALFAAALSHASPGSTTPFPHVAR